MLHFCISCHFEALEQDKLTGGALQAHFFKIGKKAHQKLYYIEVEDECEELVYSIVP